MYRQKFLPPVKSLINVENGESTISVITNDTMNVNNRSLRNLYS